MKITFVGTSHGYPEFGRKLSCTMLEIDGYIYFIDAGAPVAQFAADRIQDKEQIRALFVTHRHSDHLGGSFEFLITVNEYWQQVSLDVVLPEQRAIALVEHVLLQESASIHRDRIRFFDLSCEPSYQDPRMKLTAIPNRHTNGLLRSYGFYIEAEGKKLLFTGDMHADLQDFPEIAFGSEELDLIVSEFAHSNIETMAPIVDKVHTKQLLFNHIYPLEDKAPTIEAWNESHCFDIRCVNDDDTFII